MDFFAVFFESKAADRLRSKFDGEMRFKDFGFPQNEKKFFFPQRMFFSSFFYFLERSTFLFASSLKKMAAKDFSLTISLEYKRQQRGKKKSFFL